MAWPKTGNNKAVRMPIMAMTTNNSTKVKPDWFATGFLMADLIGGGDDKKNKAQTILIFIF